MKKPTLALPLIAAAALSLAACSKPNDAANATSSDVVLNDEDAGASGNFVAEDPYGNTVALGNDEAPTGADGVANAQ